MPSELPEIADSGAQAPAQDALFAIAYHELKRLARRERGRAHALESMDTTALVHETFLKIRQHDGARNRDPLYLRALAARAMRQILIDRARARLAAKHGAAAQRVSLSALDLPDDRAPFELVAVDRALAALEALDARLARLVEMHVFAGFSMPEVAAALGVAERTAFRDWRRARAFLILQLDAVH